MKTSPRSAGSQPVTVIFSWDVLEGQEAAFEKWIHGIVQAGSKWPGHLGVTTLKPAKGSSVYQSVLHFDTNQHLTDWLTSTERLEWFHKLHGIAQTHSTRATGLETWFDLPAVGVTPPPKWKMVVVTFIGVYPVSILLNAYFPPYTKHLGLLVRALVFPVIAPIVLTYFILPFLTQRVFKGWLYKRGHVYKATAHVPSAGASTDPR